ncbi:SPOR domain-containing protein [Sulfurimonas paralvinellae]|uniref:SPOR domain-containing protein n=1 Tax=Sulfurimonas paralvinellae TaxID=317658 RepID=A0A7M1B8C9_9BACT|nr:SPOR domain-containing protein [Sulfurimonas paralvinellae]QOP45980.1 SPOR domain-containing protein [Sulfurimonas paralvinellae]
MDDKNELSDIVLNKGNASGSNKKLILAVATLGVVLIIVVMLMNSMNSGSNDNLPQAVLPPKPQKEAAQQTPKDEPLFEEVQVMQDDASSDADLDKIAQKLKEESAAEEESSAAAKPAPVAVKQPVKKAVKKVTKPAQKPAPVTHTATASGSYYIQVGSFSKYKPNKKFLASIKSLGLNYKFHKVGTLNKVLVGPFKTRKEANNAKRVLRAKVEPGAFLVKL